MSENYYDGSVDPEPVEDRSDFVAAARGQAFDVGQPCPTCDGGGTVRPGRRIVHCLGSFTGADWDEDAVVRTIETARSVDWLAPSDYQLKVIDAKGATWRFQVRKPEAVA